MILSFLKAKPEWPSHSIFIPSICFCVMLITSVDWISCGISPVSWVFAHPDKNIAIETANSRKNIFLAILDKESAIFYNNLSISVYCGLFEYSVKMAFCIYISSQSFAVAKCDMRCSDDLLILKHISAYHGPVIRPYAQLCDIICV